MLSTKNEKKLNVKENGTDGHSHGPEGSVPGTECRERRAEKQPGHRHHYQLLVVLPAKMASNGIKCLARLTRIVLVLGLGLFFQALVQIFI